MPSPIKHTYWRAWHIVGQPMQICHMQLWNGGTKQITVKRLLLTTTEEASCCLLISSAPLPHGIVEDSAAGNGAGANGGLYGDGHLSTSGELRWFVDSEQLGGQLLNFWLPAYRTLEVSAIEGWHIPPGRGLLVRLGKPSIGLYGSFKWVE